MSDQNDKIKNSKRRYHDVVAIKRQVKIAKSHGLIKNVRDKLMDESHRLSKHHAMDCGVPNCMLCGNPRRKNLKTKDKLTNQERKFLQDTDTIRSKKGNGLLPDDPSQI